MRRWPWLLGLMMGLLAPTFVLPNAAYAVPPGEDGAALTRAASALRELRVEDADPVLRRLAISYPDDLDVLAETALLDFHQGDYASAVERINRATTARAPQAQKELRDLIVATEGALRHFVETRSEDGRYYVRYAPGPDAMLVPYALSALRAADEAISDRLGYRAPGPIRLEIYPTPATLAAVSSLTVADIERTGTIALCKWDRLMVTSPRALLRGYPWTDTLAHEMVHLVLARASRDQAPVWVHEGIAKFLERTYRGETPAAHLEPEADALLADALSSSSLLPFDALHPSIARLPSQEAAALAFAQVATFIETYDAEYGEAALKRSVERMANGEDAREALAGSAGTSFSTLETSWRQGLTTRPPAVRPPRRISLVFRRGIGASEESEIPEERARRFFRLGNLLHEHGRFRAASREYERALALSPSDPIIASRMARSAILGGEGEQAIEPLRAVLNHYPEHAPLWSALSSAERSRGAEAESRAAALEALRLNPFDPSPHCDLAEVAEGEEVRAREATTCRQLGGR